MPLPSIQTRTRWNDRKPSIVVFDVNETLIDIDALGRCSSASSETDASCGSGSASWSCIP